MQKINKVIAVKLRRLLSFLHHAGGQFEKVAGKTEDKNIRMSIREVALETNQYEQELNAQLLSLRIKNINIVSSGDSGDLIENEDLNSRTITDKEILDHCCRSEVYFERAYRSVLNEYFSFNELRQLLICQLNGIKYAFMQLKLLKSVYRTGNVLVGQELF